MIIGSSDMFMPQCFMVVACGLMYMIGNIYDSHNTLYQSMTLLHYFTL